MAPTKTVGLLLQSISYLGQKRILKILTPEHGLISLFAKSGDLAPFCLAEWIYLPSHRELHTLEDAALLDPLLELRESYSLLTSAGSIAQDLLRTQFPNKKAPFALACAYFKKLSLNPPVLAASFRLKLLLHEGLLSFDPEPCFTPAEWEQVRILTFSRQFSQIANVANIPHGKIQSLFDEKIDR